MNPKAALALFALSTSSIGCAIASYDTDPQTAWDARPQRMPDRRVLQYTVGRVPSPTLGGYTGLHEAMARNGVFADSRHVKPMPTEGLWVAVVVEAIGPSAPAAVFGYASVATLTLLPAYTGTSGFYVRYHVHWNGKEVRKYEYRIYRKAFIWLPVLLFSWANFITDSEGDAFEAVTRQFFLDAIRDGAFQPPGAS